MNNVDYDKKKFTKDQYGNLIPKKTKKKVSKAELTAEVARLNDKLDGCVCGVGEG